MEADIVSVIVPIYNSASVLERCLISVLNQTYSNLELVLVDDGSTDNSFEICKSFQNKDARIKLFKKENGGVSSARNFGLEKSTGSWVTFLDSDDFLEVNFISDLMAETSTEMLVGGFKRFGDKNDEIVPLGQTVCIKTDLDALWNKTVDKFIYWYPWGKLYKLDVIRKNNLLFNEQMFYSEDFCFLLSYLVCIDSFSVKSVAGYCHLYEKSRSKKYRMDFLKFQKHLYFQDLALEKLESKHGHFYKLVRKNVHRRLSDNFLYNLLSVDSYKTFKEERYKFRTGIDSESLLSEITSSKKRKISNFIVYKTFPFVGYVMKNILKYLLA